MVKLDATYLRYLRDEHFAVLRAVEKGMRQYDVVPTDVIRHLSHQAGGSIANLIRDLARDDLIIHDASQHDGYSLSYAGLDYLALHSFAERGTVKGLGSRMGCGKESDLYLAEGPNGEDLVVKFQRLGRTSFKSVARNRDYRGDRGPRLGESFQVLSCRAADKEYKYLTALHSAGFPTARPVDHDRHAVVMSCLRAHTLVDVSAMAHPTAVYIQCLELLTRLAENGLVHGDFNEFNLMVDSNERVYMLDFPQMVVADAAEAADLFARDVSTIHAFFARRYKIPPLDYNPTLPEASSKTSSGATALIQPLTKQPFRNQGAAPGATLVDDDALTGASGVGDGATSVAKGTAAGDAKDGTASTVARTTYTTATTRGVGKAKAAAVMALRAKIEALGLTASFQSKVRNYLQSMGPSAVKVEEKLRELGTLEEGGAKGAPRADDAEGSDGGDGGDGEGYEVVPLVEQMPDWVHPRGRSSRIVREQAQGAEWCGGQRVAAPQSLAKLGGRPQGGEEEVDGSSNGRPSEVVSAQRTVQWPPRGAVVGARLEDAAAKAVVLEVVTTATGNGGCEVRAATSAATQQTVTAKEGVDDAAGGVVVVDGVVVRVGCALASSAAGPAEGDSGRGPASDSGSSSSDSDGGADVPKNRGTVRQVVATFKAAPSGGALEEADGSGSGSGSDAEEGTSTVVTRKGSKRSRRQQKALLGLANGTVTASTHQQRRKHPFPQSVATSRAVARRSGGVMGAMAAAGVGPPGGDGGASPKGLAAHTKSAIDLEDARVAFEEATKSPAMQAKVRQRLQQQATFEAAKKAAEGGLRNVQGDRRQRKAKRETKAMIDSREWDEDC